MTETPTPVIFRMKDRWLLLARCAWFILALVTIAIFILGIIELYTGWQKPCSSYVLQDQTDCFAQDQAFQQFGLTRNFFSIYYSILEIGARLPWMLAGVLIFWKKSEEPFGVLFSLMFIVTGTFTIDSAVAEMIVRNHPALQTVVNGLWFIGDILIVLWYCFPDGRFALRWLRWAAILWITLSAGVIYFPTTLFNFFNWPVPSSDVIIIMLAASLINSLAFRYRHTSELVQRQQIKWVVLSVSTLAVVRGFQNLVFMLTDWGLLNWTDRSSLVWRLTYSPVFYMSIILVAVCFGISILRYRLWDIDFIFNRSLVYGALTALLAVIFGGSLLFVSLFVQGQSFVIAFGITAMVAGTSFNPARRRIQRFVDQRLYHIEIDYQKTPPAVATGATVPVVNFGSYQNLELIGRGGMAEVYKSTLPGLGTPVAIKILVKALAAEPEYQQRFAREVQVVATLAHPNIVRILDSGEQDGSQYLVMEYLGGKDLNQMIQKDGRLSLAQTLPLVQQIAAALDYAHANGFVHRDIKPSNILLDSNNLRAVLTDFGIAKINNANTAMTRTGYMLGTFDYVAPEQIQESSKVDGRADIYSLGVMVYQMLTGTLPFNHGNPGALLIAHLNQPAPDACEILPDLPQHISVAIQRAMAKMPDERFGIADEFAQALIM